MFEKRFFLFLAAKIGKILSFPHILQPQKEVNSCFIDTTSPF